MVKVYKATSKAKSLVRDNTLEKYLSIILPEHFLKWNDFLFHDMWSYDSKKSNYKILESKILELKNLFKMRVYDLNKLAQDNGFENYLEYSLHINEIPQGKYKYFVENVDRYINEIQRGEVYKKLIENNKDWNNFNTPYPLGLRIWQKSYGIPDEVLTLVDKYDKRVKKYRNKIIFELESETDYSFARLLKSKQKVKVCLKKQRDDIYKSLNFIHELGHALDLLEKTDKGIDVHKVPKFEKEYEAEVFERKFIKENFSERSYNYYHYNKLQTIVATLFEIEVFTKPDQDYDVVYANAIKRCYPAYSENENPFYVIYKRFIMRPMGGLTASTIETELFLHSLIVNRKKSDKMLQRE
jgi:hypothetical protein